MQDDFDKNFNRVFRLSIGAIVIYSLMVLAAFGVGIWALIYVVTHIGGWIN